MLILLTKSQSFLFDAPVHVDAHVRRDGTLVAAHTRVQRVASKPVVVARPAQAPAAQEDLFGADHAVPAAPAKRSKLDKFIASHGGHASLAAKLAQLTAEQQAMLFEKMAALDGVKVEEVRERFAGVKPREAVAAPVSDVIDDASHESAVPDSNVMPAESAPQATIVEHTTRKGKVIRGAVRRDLDGNAAAAIDPYTFRKDGGWFIREKYLTGEAAVAPQAVDTQDDARERKVVAEKVDKSKSQAQKLREAGEKLLADAQADYGRDRLANTMRRARMAASAEADASKRIATAKTMLNLAGAIEDGDARYLTGVTTRAAVETLERALSQAMHEADRSLPYVEQQARRGREPEPNDIRLAKLPRPSWSNAGANVSHLVEALKGKKGGPAMVAEISASAAPTSDMIARLKKLVGQKALDYGLGWWNIEAAARVARLQRIGINTDLELQLALTELVRFRDGHQAVDPVKQAERALVGQKVGVDFFPTPKLLARTMAEKAGIKPGMRVLEPSAGSGHLADAARDAGGDVHAVEISDTLRNVLTAKKHAIVAHDFETFEPGEKYDAVLMNPPFSNRMDAAHITRAWDMVKPGGRLVAIAGEGVFLGSDQKARAFREWLDEHGAEVEHLPANTFKGADLPAQTGANARLIVMEKPQEAAAAPTAPAAHDTGPREGDRNADGLVFRDGRWHRDEEPAVGVVEPAQADPVDADPVEAAEDRADLAEELARNPHSDRSKALLADVGRREAAHEDAIAPEDDPSSPNYRYADTGYIAGARKENAPSSVIRKAKTDGAQVLVTGIDWQELERNPREARELITKSNLFGSVDWDALRGAGMQPEAGFVVDRIYASIGQEPTEDNAAARRDYTLGLQTLRERLEKCKTADDVASVLDNLREEYDGKVLNAEESDRYKSFASTARQAWLQEQEIHEKNRELQNAMYAAQRPMHEVQGEIEKRQRRGWSAKPELAAQLPPLVAAAQAAEKQWVDHLHATKDRRDELEEMRREAHTGMRMIETLALARNKLENPLHRAWTLMGERFVNVLRFRSYKGSDTFAKHMAAAKAGRIKDWSWAEKDVTRAPKITKESARFQLKVADQYERVGGRDVLVDGTQALKARFGLRDVQSGNWVLRDVASAKFHVEHCAAAFADLADLLGASDAEISLNGRLAMAFGARGHGAKGFKDGAARADYNPVHRVINLTKMGGGGCLAHEWFHALDNIIKEAEGVGEAGVDDYVTANPDVLPDGDLKTALVALRSAMLDGDQKATEVVKYSAADVRLAQHNLTGRMVNPVGQMVLAAGNVHAAVEAIDRRFNPRGQPVKQLTPRTKKLIRDWTRIAVAHYGGKPEGGDIEVRGGPSMSSFAAEAAKLDQGGTAYFATPVEMAARAFQGWVEDKLSTMGRRNDYLSAYADNKYHVDPLFGIEWKPYPEGEERQRINAAFDRLVAVLGQRGTLAKALGMVG